MSRAHPHAKNQRGWFPCAGPVTGSGSRVSEEHPPGAQHRAGSQNLLRPWPGPMQGLWRQKGGSTREALGAGRPLPGVVLGYGFWVWVATGLWF